VSLKNKHSSLHILVVWVWEDNDEKEKFALDKIRLLAMGPDFEQNLFEEPQKQALA
jgi:hypothetical protein